MKINWFPGHMTKALRMMEEEIKNIDVVIYVLDARAPYSSVNPKFSDICKNKPILYILNKADLADDKETSKWKTFFECGNSRCMTLTSIVLGAKKEVMKNLTSLCEAKIEKYRKKDVKVGIRAIVIGVPNSGKSTLINNICEKAKAITGDKPGVTRGKQWLSAGDNIEVLDTPGTLWPSFESQETALNLAYIGSIKAEVLDMTELGLELLKTLYKLDCEKVIERYGEIEMEVDPLFDVAKKRHFLVSGGEADYDRAALAVIDDFRKCRIGKITLEKCNAI